MLSLILFIHIAQANSRQGSLDKGIFFNEETNILLAEKFINVQFLVPFPRFEMTLISSVDQIAQSLQKMWQNPTYFCYLNFTNTSEVDFKMDWLFKETEKEISFAQTDLLKIKSDVASFLKGKQENQKDTEKTSPSVSSCSRRRNRFIRRWHHVWIWKLWDYGYFWLMSRKSKTERTEY